MPLAVGDKLGPYDILAQLGAGGMGEVYKARDTRLDRLVAIKTSKVEFTERFHQEARAIAALNHPNICTLHDIGPNFLVMELVEGSSPSGPLPLDEVLRIGRQIAAALAEAHDKHITHRDLKPGNLMIKPDGSVKVLDFGLAKLTPPIAMETSPDMSPTLSLAPTEAGMILGTAAYMAPEQAKGKVIDKRADIWAFGVVLYELLTGRRPFQGDDVSEIFASVIKEQPDYEAVPHEVRRLIRRCLEKDPSKRLRDISDVWDLLDERMTAPSAGSALSNKRSWLPWSAAAALAATTVIAVWAPWRMPPLRPALKRLEITLPTPNRPIEVSPDGRLLSFNLIGQDSKPTLWLRAFDSAESRALPGTEGIAGSWFWSPDSRFIAFFHDGKLKKIDVESGVVLVIAENVPQVLGGSWNNDGILIFGSRTGVQKVEVSVGAVTTLTIVDRSKEFDHIFPRFLPDGRHFVYVKNALDAQSGSQIAVGSLDTPAADQPTDGLTLTQGTQQGGGGANRIYFIPASDAGPGKLVFRRDGVVLAQSFDPDKLSLSGEPAPLSFGQINYFTAASGVLVFNSTDLNKSQLVILGRDGKELARLGSLAGGQDELNASWDGSRIALTRTSGSTASAVWVFELGRDTATKLSSDNLLAATPVWSPDDKQILFTNRRGFEVFQKAASGAGNEQSLFKAQGYPQDWSRDGRFLLFTQTYSGAGASNLMVIPIGNGTAGGEVRPYLTSPAQEIQGKFSADTHWVAYTSNESGIRQVYVSSFPDPNGQKVPISTDGGSMPRWSRDGNEVFYFTPDNNLMSVSFSVVGGVFKRENPKRLFTVPVPRNMGKDTWGTGWDVLPGGRFLINTSLEQGDPPPVSVMLNWESAIP